MAGNVSEVDPANRIHTRIWREDAETDNPFATRVAYCRGYDVYGEMVGNARWIEMLYLLLRPELPDRAKLDLLEALAVALANPGPRDASVHAAMCGGVAGSTAAASLIAALSVGAGRQGGAREVFDAMKVWDACDTDYASWISHVPESTHTEIWPERAHPPGFDPHGISTPLVVRQLIDSLARIAASPRLSWLAEYRATLEHSAGLPLAVTGVAAAAFKDLGFSAAEGEMLYLLLRLPGAAAHALEQDGYGYKRFPFYRVELEDDPMNKVKP